MFDVVPVAVEPGSIDLIIADLPYGVTDHNLAPTNNTMVDLTKFWGMVDTVLQPWGLVVTTCLMKLAVELINSRPGWFRYDLVYEKPQGTNFFAANDRPLRSHETVLVFSPESLKRTTYNPQMEHGDPYQTGPRVSAGMNYGEIQGVGVDNQGTRMPKSVLRFSKGDDAKVHPTQKPVDLYNWLVRTYSNPGDLVLDPCAGGGTTGIACLESGRNAILVEIWHDMFLRMEERVRKFREYTPTL
jgi:site-specific DNA-methyltransferase (adenine-specific)